MNDEKMPPVFGWLRAAGRILVSTIPGQSGKVIRIAGELVRLEHEECRVRASQDCPGASHYRTTLLYVLQRPRLRGLSSDERAAVDRQEAHQALCEEWPSLRDGPRRTECPQEAKTNGNRYAGPWRTHGNRRRDS